MGEPADTGLPGKQPLMEVLVVVVVVVAVVLHYAAAVSAMKKAGCCERTMSRVLKARERPGALWHIYDPRDADRIRQLLTEVLTDTSLCLGHRHYCYYYHHHNRFTALFSGPPW